MRRVLLFDIDGTLVWGGPARDAFVLAMEETYGTAGDPDNVSFGGKTDPQIARELLEGAGFSRQQIEARFPDLWQRYTAHLQKGLVDRPVTVLPGVQELLDALRDFSDLGMALLTGNIVRGAELKLGSAGLYEHFEIGSFGSDHEERDELPGIVLTRARVAWRDSIRPSDAIVIGDTPRDVQCGRAGGTRTLAVATGHFALEELVATGADHVLPDLTDTERVLEILSA